MEHDGTEAFRLLACGGRGFSDWEWWWRMLDGVLAKHPGLVLIEGGNRPKRVQIAGRWLMPMESADYLAHLWAMEREVRCLTRPAAWSKHFKSAGAIRNGEMLKLDRPDACIAAPGGEGTANMVARCCAAGVPVWIPRLATAA